MNVCDTPQARGTPTNSQARATDTVELGSSLLLGYEFGCGFISISDYGDEKKNLGASRDGGGFFHVVPLAHGRHQ